MLPTFVLIELSVVVFHHALPVISVNAIAAGFFQLALIVMIHSFAQRAHALSEALELAQHRVLERVTAPEIEVIGAAADAIATAGLLVQRQLFGDGPNYGREMIEHGCFPTGGMVEPEHELACSVLGRFAAADQLNAPRTAQRETPIRSRSGRAARRAATPRHHAESVGIPVHA